MIDVEVIISRNTLASGSSQEDPDASAFPLISRVVKIRCAWSKYSAASKSMISTELATRWKAESRLSQAAPRSSAPKESD